MAIRPSDGDFKSGDTLMFLDKSRLITTPGFSTLPHFTCITHKLHHNTTLTHTFILDIFLYLQDVHHPAMRSIEKVQKYKTGYTLASILGKTEPKPRKLYKGRYEYTQTHM